MDKNELFYDRKTGKIIDEEVSQILNTHVGYLDNVGVTSPSRVTIEDDHIAGFEKNEETSLVLSTPKEIKTDIMGIIQEQNVIKDEQQNRIKRDRQRKRRLEVERYRKVVTVSAVLILGAAATFGVIKVKNFLEDNDVRTQATISINSYVEPEIKTIADNLVVKGIVERNTSMTNDNNGIFYDNTGIAIDLLKLDDNMFDAGLYTVYNDMGGHRDNDYHNFDSLDDFVSLEKNPAIYNKFHGCRNFDDYLIKNGFINEDNTPSREKFEKYGKDELLRIADYAKIVSEERIDNYQNGYGGR